jgi:hypothetical protein
MFFKKDASWKVFIPGLVKMEAMGWVHLVFIPLNINTRALCATSLLSSTVPSFCNATILILSKCGYIKYEIAILFKWS